MTYAGLLSKRVHETLKELARLYRVAMSHPRAPRSGNSDRVATSSPLLQLLSSLCLPFSNVFVSMETVLLLVWEEFNDIQKHQIKCIYIMV